MRYLAVVFSLSLLAFSAGKFRPDDPLEFELKPIPVTDAAKRKLSDYYDTVVHTVDTPGEVPGKKPQSVPARAVNTLGEPLQGSWWVKRQYYHPLPVDDFVAGPGKDHAPSMLGKWTVIGAKTEGITPGFLMVDGKKEMFFIKFDPMTNPEMATGADHVAIRLVHALGYHVPENYLVEFGEDILVIGKDVEIANRLGRRHLMTRRDLSALLLKVPKTKGGLFRATASRAIPGKGIGPYRYYGTRLDDPNDFVPHEHRRDLRGLAVVAAWIGHDDSRAVNTYDTIVEENGVSFIKHYILDLGSALGSGTQRPNSARSGGEYLFGWKQSALQLFTLGLAVPYWATADFPDIPSVGLFEYKTFDPERWVPEYPNPAFLNRLPDDEFWAAKQIVSIGDKEIRAVVQSARYSDTKAEAWIVECLIQRRDKIGKAYFRKVLPLDRFRIEKDTLVFDDLSEKAGLGGSGPHSVQWLPEDDPGYRVARITSAARPKQTIDVTLRGDAVVGIDRKW